MILDELAGYLTETIRLRSYVTLLRGVHATLDARLPELPLRLPIARLPALDDADLRIWDPTFVVARVPPSEPAHCAPGSAIDRLNLKAHQEETVSHGAVATMELLLARHQGIKLEDGPC